MWRDVAGRSRQSEDRDLSLLRRAQIGVGSTAVVGNVFDAEFRHVLDGECPAEEQMHWQPAGTPLDANISVNQGVFVDASNVEEMSF